MDRLHSFGGEAKSECIVVDTVGSGFTCGYGFFFTDFLTRIKVS